MGMTVVRVQGSPPRACRSWHSLLLVYTLDGPTTLATQAVDTCSLNPPASFSDLRKFVTKQIPVNLGGGSNESEAYVADFRQLIVGMRTDIRLEISRVSESAFSKLQFQLRSYLRADIALAQPTHFVVITEIQP